MIPWVEQQLAASLVTLLGTSYQRTSHHYSWQPQQSLHASNHFDRLQAMKSRCGANSATLSSTLSGA